jgi:hypothetical protein
MTIDFAALKMRADAALSIPDKLAMRVEPLLDSVGQTPDFVRLAIKLVDVAGDVTDWLADVRNALHQVQARPTDPEGLDYRQAELREGLEAVTEIRTALSAYPEIAVMAGQLIDDSERSAQRIRKQMLDLFKQDADAIYPTPPAFSLADWITAAEAELRSALGGEVSK